MSRVSTVLMPAHVEYGSRIAGARREHNRSEGCQFDAAHEGGRYDIGPLGEMAISILKESGTVELDGSQVRTTRLSDSCLILHEDDQDDKAFILVTCEDFPTFTARGFAYGRDGKQERFHRSSFFPPTEGPAEKAPMDQWLVARKEAGLKIDPHVAEVTFCWGYTTDPYGIHSDLSEEEEQVGRVYFARSPGSDTWASFRDLSDEIRDKLWNRIDSGALGPHAGFHVDKGGKVSWREGV